MKNALLLLLCCFFAHGADTPERIISLAPHTTEMAFALGVGDKLLAASDFSDYPDAAKALPRVADHNGVNFEAIMRLQPDLILAWQGGNKPQDLTRLNSLGFTVFLSSPATPEDIATELQSLGALVGQDTEAAELAGNFRQALMALRQQHSTKSPVQVFYYMWPKPLMSIGQGAWANHLLDICGARNVFSDLATPYPEVTIEKVIRRTPDIIVAAYHTTDADVQNQWKDWQSVLNSRYVNVNPDALHRFSPRLIDGLKELCSKLN